MNSIRDKVIEKQSEGMPNGKIVNYFDANLDYYLVDDIPKTAARIPDCVIEKNQQTLFGYTKDHVSEEHTIVVGYTGSGKSTRVLINGVISYLQKGCSVCITDPSGELYDILYGYLSDKKITTKVINFTDSTKSDSFNPFYALAIECLKKKEFTLDVEKRLSKMFETLMPITPKVQDPYWLTQARHFVLGSTFLLFEDLIDGYINPEDINFHNIFELVFTLRNLTTGENIIDFKKNKFLQKKENSRAIRLIRSIIEDAPRTKANVYSSIDGAINHLTDKNFLSLTTRNDIVMSDIWEKQQVIFISDDNTKAGETLCGIFMEQLFEAVKVTTRSKPRRRLDREIGCFLDEFCNINICDSDYFIKMLTQSRKHGLFFNMFIQDYNQLKEKYGSYSTTIRGNSTEIFINTKDYESRSLFAEQCGKTTYESLDSRFKNSYPVLLTKTLISAEQLNKTPIGHCYINRLRSDLLYTYYEAYYNLSYFKVRDRKIVYPNNFVNLDEYTFNFFGNEKFTKAKNSITVFHQLISEHLDSKEKIDFTDILRESKIVPAKLYEAYKSVINNSCSNDYHSTNFNSLKLSEDIFALLKKNYTNDYKDVINEFVIKLEKIQCFPELIINCFKNVISLMGDINSKIDCIRDKINRLSITNNDCEGW